MNIGDKVKVKPNGSAHTYEYGMVELINLDTNLIGVKLGNANYVLVSPEKIKVLDVQ